MPITIPFTLNGTGQENINTTLLLAAEERGEEMSKNEKKALNAQTINPPQTINYANKMMQAFTTVLKVGGEVSFAYLVAKEMANWVNKNKQVAAKYQVPQ